MKITTADLLGSTLRRGERRRRSSERSPSPVDDDIDNGGDDAEWTPHKRPRTRLNTSPSRSQMIRQVRAERAELLKCACSDCPMDAVVTRAGCMRHGTVCGQRCRECATIYCACEHDEQVMRPQRDSQLDDLYVPKCAKRYQLVEK